MSSSQDYIFVLWGDGFDEAVATIFITELREAGFPVRVVGLTPRKLSGAHGLVLVSDLTLDQALSLASQVVCLIVPSASRWGERYKNDPRVPELFNRANANLAKFVMRGFTETMQISWGLPVLSKENVMEYPDVTNLIEFARHMASLLSSHDY